MHKWKKIKVPEREVHNTGDLDSLTVTPEDFFTAVEESLNLSDFTKKMEVHIHSRRLNYRDKLHHESDEEMIYLVIKDVVVASVFYRRTKMNWIEVSYACYLSDKIVRYLEFDRGDSQA